MRQQFFPGCRIDDVSCEDEALTGKAIVDTIEVFYSTLAATLGFRHQSAKPSNSIEKPQ
jgi:hypothetical protein